MIGRLALRSLLMHPLRTAVLAGGFGLGVAVMANLLGVAEVVLEQSQSPALAGGGDLVVTGVAGGLASARYVLWGALGAPAFADRVAVASPTRRASVYLVQSGVTTHLRARAGIPSLERALEDPETAGHPAWRDAPGDEAWVSPDAADVLRSLDRFHPIPDVPDRASSWTEWLYFNGQAGSTRFYLTFLVGPLGVNGRRAAGVRLQLDRSGQVSTFGETAEVDPAVVLATSPELTIGNSRVRLDGERYLVSFDLPGDGGGSAGRRGSSGARAVGEIGLAARRGSTLPPFTITGARGWVSGYVVPVMSGRLDGTIRVAGDVLPLAGGTGYHDHNWGFWEGVSWQWGQVQHEGLSILYGRVFPPADAADASRIPGFLMVLGPEGPLGQATRVSIEEAIDPARSRPSRITVRGNSPSLDLRLDVDVESAIRTPMRDGPLAEGLDFLQMRGRYRVSGTAGERKIDFVAPGSAETFRGR
ncbi:MAG: hypothetical protein IT180_18915 [Acidobacteria bacterium]|nr:hypothetical protein [Acidobacteriota bacterium]